MLRWILLLLFAMTSCLQEPTTSNFGESIDNTTEDISDETVDIDVTVSWFENQAYTKVLLSLIHI